MKNKRLKRRFCYTCGQELTQKERVYAYDEKTGGALITVDFSCPNRFFFAFWHVMDRFMLDCDQ